MSRYDGLIIPRSYSEYINKTDAATLLQALQLSGVMDSVPTPGSNHPVKSGGIEYLIWENPDSTQPVANNTTITFDRAVPNGYTKLLVEAGNLIPGNSYVFYTECRIGKYNYLALPFTAQDGSIYLPSRIIDSITTTSCRIGICRFYNSLAGFEEVENRIIPLRIWAIA